MRRHALVALLFASLLGAGALVLTGAPPSTPGAVSPGPELGDGRASTSFGNAASDAVGAVLTEPTERLGDVARSEPRASARHVRTTDWAVAVVVATATIAALAITRARRRTGRTAVRAGRVAPARAPPPLFLSCS